MGWPLGLGLGTVAVALIVFGLGLGQLPLTLALSVLALLTSLGVSRGICPVPSPASTVPSPRDSMVALFGATAEE